MIYVVVVGGARKTSPRHPARWLAPRTVISDLRQVSTAHITVGGSLSPQLYINLLTS